MYLTVCFRLVETAFTESVGKRGEGRPLPLSASLYIKFGLACLPSAYQKLSPPDVLALCQLSLVLVVAKSQDNSHGSMNLARKCKEGGIRSGEAGCVAMES